MIANGPLRTVFELGYEPWDAGDGVKVSEVKRFTLDAGHNLHRVESTFTVVGAGEVVVALGLGKHKEVTAVLDRNSGGWLTQWEKYPKATEGDLGTAVLLEAGAFQGFVEDDLNQLALVPIKSGGTLRYALGAGWSLGSEFTTAEKWNVYVAAFAARVRAPVTVTVVATASPRVMFIRGFEGAVVENIRSSDSTFNGVTETEVVQHAGTIILSNVTIAPARRARSLNSVPTPVTP